jgi:beta-lactam-binding protein with PASTA domain
VPKVVKKPLGAAKRAIAAAHCTTGKVSRAYSKKVKKGRVIKQKPAAGTELANGGKVNLTVSRGRPPAAATAARGGRRRR